TCPDTGLRPGHRSWLPKAGRLCDSPPRWWYEWGIEPGARIYSRRTLAVRAIAAAGEAPPQLGYPLLDGFRRVLQLVLLDLAGTLHLQSPGMLLVAPVDSYEGRNVGWEEAVVSDIFILYGLWSSCLRTGSAFSHPRMSLGNRYRICGSPFFEY